MQNALLNRYTAREGEGGGLMYNLPGKKQPTRFLNPSISIEKYKKLRVQQLLTAI